MPKLRIMEIWNGKDNEHGCLFRYYYDKNRSHSQGKFIFPPLYHLPEKGKFLLKEHILIMILKLQLSGKVLGILILSHELFKLGLRQYTKSLVITLTSYSKRC